MHSQLDVSFSLLNGSNENLQSPFGQRILPTNVKLAWYVSMQMERNRFETQIMQQAEAQFTKEANKILKGSLEPSNAADDPLQTWLNYISWARENLTSAESNSKEFKETVLPLLVRCANRFTHDNRYKNNIEYLKVWLAIAYAVNDPLPIFIILHNANIGQVLHFNTFVIHNKTQPNREYHYFGMGGL